MMLKKSQSGIEFLIVFGIVLFLFSVFLVLIQTTTEEKNREKESLLIKNLALSIQDEINLATETSDGYSREFYAPLQILGNDYEIKIADSFIYIKTEKNAVSFKVDNVTGKIKKGKNTIKKENGKVYLNYG